MSRNSSIVIQAILQGVGRSIPFVFQSISDNSRGSFYFPTSSPARGVLAVLIEGPVVVGHSHVGKGREPNCCYLHDLVTPTFKNTS